MDWSGFSAENLVASSLAKVLWSNLQVTESTVRLNLFVGLAKILGIFYPKWKKLASIFHLM